MGFAQPYGIAFHADGRLFVTEHGIDERGGRYIIGDVDDFYEERSCLVRLAGLLRRNLTGRPALVRGWPGPRAGVS